MIGPFIRKKYQMLVFGLAALFPPFTILVPTSCGTACGMCPLSGGCLALPLVAACTWAFSFRSRILAIFGKIIPYFSSQ